MEWPVEVNVDFLSTQPESLILNLPGQESIALFRDRSEIRGTGGFLWSGSGNGCSGIFSAIPEHIIGTISCASGSFMVRSTSAGDRLAKNADVQEPPGAANDVLIPSGLPGSTTLAIPSVPSQPSTLTSGDPIDVLILYTASVRLAVTGTGGNVQLEMQHLVDVTQQAMINSASVQTGFPLANVNLVHAQEVTRGEGATLDLDLVWLTEVAEPISLRNYWNADIIMFVRESKANNYCGQAYTPGLGTPDPSLFSPYAGGVAVRDCTYAPYNFQHEFAHILGANHNEENNENPKSTMLAGWALAHWKNPASMSKNGLRTIVSYKVNIGPPDPPVVCRNDCVQVLNYANSEVWNNDDWPFQTGVDEMKENARIIAYVAPFAAQWKTGNDRIFASGFD